MYRNIYRLIRYRTNLKDNIGPIRKGIPKILNTTYLFIYIFAGIFVGPQIIIPAI